MRPGSPEFYASCRFYASREAYRLLSLDKILKRDWRIREFYKWDIPRGRLLDVGCGHGEFVRAAGLLGYQAFGVDMDEKAIAVARRIGIANVTVGRAEDCKEGPFQVITCFDVLEHLEDPVAVVRSFATSLAPNGRIVISLPAWDCGPFLLCPDADNPPHHLTLWTETAVKALADRTGLAVLKMTRMPYCGQNWIVRCRHECAWINRDVLPIKVLRRLLLAVFTPAAALFRVLFHWKGYSLLALLAPNRGERLANSATAAQSPRSWSCARKEDKDWGMKR
jgi:2-polyprenyl-3-methyl-5-hydroxy-6-metoxy-1,4-benzoquinol methylase